MIRVFDNDNNTEIEQLTNKDWTELIAKQFDVSKSQAKEMLHAMYSVYECKKRVAEAIARDRVLPKKGNSLIRECFGVNDALNQDDLQKGLGE